VIVVTGASGFVGRRLAARLATERPGSELRCLVKANDDAFGRSGERVLEKHGIRPVGVDLRPGRGLDGLATARTVFHLAANTRTWEADQSCNDEGTRRFLDALEPLGPGQHVVFTGTVAVMDNRRDLGSPLRADTPVEGNPLSHYGATKWRGERLLRERARERGFSLSVVRLCTVYGPGPRPNSFFDALKKEVARGSLASRLDWPGLTSFVHVDDVVSALLSEADDPPPPGQARTKLLATESKTLQEVAAMLYMAKGLAYRLARLPKAVWRGLAQAHRACRLGRICLPAPAYNFLWRFNLVVNPVFHCDTEASLKSFPGLAPRRMEDEVMNL
jgi:nucleoside-diphosphate-sugar epimerase